MTSFSLLFGLSLAAFFIIFRMISKYRYATMNELNNQQYEITSRHESMRTQKRDLQREIATKEQALATLKSNVGAVRSISVADLEVASGSNENEKIGQYLMNQGKLTREQHERAIKKMEVLKMDYIGVCMALGFIDLETGTQAKKAGKVSTPVL